VIRIVLVCEGATDQSLVCDLADRVLREEVDWMRDFPTLDDLRSYGGLDESREYVMWSKVRALFQESGLRISRRFGNANPNPDYVAMHKLLLLIANHHHRSSRGGGGVDGVLIFRDVDHQLERRKGLQDAREDFVKGDESSRATNPWRQHIAIAVAEPKNEAWVLAGFEPANDGEHEALAVARQELGFAPNESPERLHARAHDAKRSAKDVLDQLCPDRDRRSRCWCETSLETLRQRGHGCGLAQFLDEVRERLAPLFGGSTRPA
jgi:hypothetical protein